MRPLTLLVVILGFFYAQASTVKVVNTPATEAEKKLICETIVYTFYDYDDPDIKTDYCGTTTIEKEISSDTFSKEITIKKVVVDMPTEKQKCQVNLVRQFGIYSVDENGDIQKSKDEWIAEVEDCT